MFVEVYEGRWINLDKVEDILIREIVIPPNKLLKTETEIKKFVVEFYFYPEDVVSVEFNTFEEARKFVNKLISK